LQRQCEVRHSAGGGQRVTCQLSRSDGFSVNKGGSHARSSCYLRRVRFGSRNLVEYASCETV
jgi:hypothetical protein